MTNHYCFKCKGVGEPKISKLGSAKPIKKCCYCFSLAIKPTKEAVVVPSWWTGEKLSHPFSGFKTG